MLKFGKIILVATLAPALLTCLSITVDGLLNASRPSEVGIVLGNKVHPSGRPSVALEKRLRHAEHLFQSGQISHLIVSGALGKEGHDEAVVMRDFLVRQGIPPARILVDSQGRNTRLTARHAKALCDRHQFGSATVISNYYHISRARLACRQEGIPVVQGSAPTYFHPSNFWSIPRDALGWWFYLLRLK